MWGNESNSTGPADTLRLGLRPQARSLPPFWIAPALHELIASSSRTGIELPTLVVEKLNEAPNASSRPIDRFNPAGGVLERRRIGSERQETVGN